LQPGSIQPLLEVLRREGLNFQSITDLCPDIARVGAQTVSDIATGRRIGTVRSRSRILNALNRYEGKSKDYTWADLFIESAEELS
jgi:hypothetical protein